MTLEDRAPELLGSVKTATRLSAAALGEAAAGQEEATRAADQTVQADQTHQTDPVVEAVALVEVKIACIFRYYETRQSIFKLGRYDAV